jgi:thioesterase domain-containing protein
VLVRGAQSELAPAGPTLGWAPLLPALTVVDTPGTHATLLRAAHGEALARLLRAALADDLPRRTDS